jgi:Cu(I)/Ag(I) efflux system protein CusF
LRPYELTTRVRKRVGLARAVLVVALAAGVAAIVSVAVDALAAQAYQTHGDIVGFGPNRSYVSIAHEAIPGYMGAMTMSFEPRRPAQLQGYEVGAHVAFTFTASDDGHRWIDQIFPQVK